MWCDSLAVGCRPKTSSNTLFHALLQASTSYLAQWQSSTSCWLRKTCTRPSGATARRPSASSCTASASQQVQQLVSGAVWNSCFSTGAWASFIFCSDMCRPDQAGCPCQKVQAPRSAPSHSSFVHYAWGLHLCPHVPVVVFMLQQQQGNDQQQQLAGWQGRAGAGAGTPSLDQQKQGPAACVVVVWSCHSPACHSPA